MEKKFYENCHKIIDVHEKNSKNLDELKKSTEKQQNLLNIVLIKNRSLMKLIKIYCELKIFKQ